jgi:hypothetical protein
MTKPFRGVINVDVTQSVPDWEPYTQPIAPEGTPNVLYIVLDDVGYSAMEPYGGLIETPNIDRIAQRGLTYTNFHTTALCSPTPTTRSDGCSTTWKRAASWTTPSSCWCLTTALPARGTERVGQREQVLQRDPGHDRGQPTVPGQTGQPGHV